MGMHLLGKCKYIIPLSSDGHAAYAAGSEAVVALVEETVAHFTAIIEQQQQRIEQQQRITALEQELQELKKDSHDSGKPPSRDSAGSVQVTVNAVVPGVCAGPRLDLVREGGGEAGRGGRYERRQTRQVLSALFWHFSHRSCTAAPKRQQRIGEDRRCGWAAARSFLDTTYSERTTHPEMESVVDGSSHDTASAP